MIDIGITGANGKMGERLLSAIETHAKLGSAYSRSPHKNATTQSLDTLFENSDVVIDFTLPEALPTVLKAAIKHEKPLVVGTTGLSDADKESILDAGNHIPILYGANMSLGVNIFYQLVKQAAEKLPETYDIEIFDIHHRRKVDAPSGTSVFLGEAAALGRKTALKNTQPRNGKRTPGEIGFASARGGDIFGEHHVYFAGDREIITLSHRATDPMIFADGVVKAALRLHGRPKGYYTTQDVFKKDI